MPVDLDAESQREPALDVKGEHSSDREGASDESELLALMQRIEQAVSRMQELDLAAISHRLTGLVEQVRAFFSIRKPTLAERRRFLRDDLPRITAAIAGAATALESEPAKAQSEYVVTRQAELWNLSSCVSSFFNLEFDATRCRILGTVYPGDHVTQIGYAWPFLQVRTADGTTGWLHQNALRRTDSAAQPTPTPTHPPRPTATATPRMTPTPQVGAQPTARSQELLPPGEYTPVDMATIHIVHAGDTLSGIAERYSVSYHRLLNANPQITNPNHITVGSRINIPQNPK